MAKKRVNNQSGKLTVDIVEARSFILVDEYGTKRADLSCHGGDGGTGGFTVVHFFDDDGRPRLSLQVDDFGNPSICLFNRNNSPAISMAANEGSGTGLSIADSDGQPRIIMGAPHAGSDYPRGLKPELTIIDEHGHQLWSVDDARPLPNIHSDQPDLGQGNEES